MLNSIFSWDTMWYVLMALYIPACLGLIIIVLLQKGKGTGFAGSFGMGAGPGADTVFGARAGQTLPVKLTYVAAVVFVMISLGMSLIAGFVGKGAAPELVEGATMSPGVANQLDDLGLGEGFQGAGKTSDESAEVPAATEIAPPAAEAPAAAETPESDPAAATPQQTTNP